MKSENVKNVKSDEKFESKETFEKLNKKDLYLNIPGNKERDKQDQRSSGSTSLSAKKTRGLHLQPCFSESVYQSKTAVLEPKILTLSVFELQKC